MEKKAISKYAPVRLYKYGGTYKLQMLKGETAKTEFKAPRVDRRKESAAVGKEYSNLQRAKSTITELGLCNDWEHFVTMTLSPEWGDRQNLNVWHKSLSQSLRDYSKKYGQKITYLLVPEKHKDGSWHMHGFISGIPPDRLTRNENGYLDWPDYAKKYGFISFKKIRNHTRASRYITKYVTKDTTRSVTDYGGHLFYASQGLTRKSIEKSGYLRDEVTAWDFENDYVCLKWYEEKDLDQAIELIR